MRSIEIKSRAKINLFLNVLYKRFDNYHEIISVLQTVELHDDIFIQKVSSGIEVLMNSYFIPKNEGNLCYDVAKYMLNKYCIKDGIKIFIKKQIPVFAGLGGGSSNCAATVKSIDCIFNLGLTVHQQQMIASMFSSDAPFFLHGGTSLVSGRGEFVKHWPKHVKVIVLIVKPVFNISTRDIYDNIKNYSAHYDRLNRLYYALVNSDIVGISESFFNDLEEIVLHLYPNIMDIKNFLLNAGALNTLLSGSGSSIFAYFSSKTEAYEAGYRLKSKKDWI